MKSINDIYRPIQRDTFYVYAEDIASALVGPFHTLADAHAHTAFCLSRGDGARMEAISSFIAARLDQSRIGLRMTADEDRNAL